MSSKVGRPSINMTKQIKFSTNASTYANIEKISQKNHLSKSDLMRKIIPEFNSMTFENALSQYTIGLINNNSEECWKPLISNKVHKTVDIKQNMPAYFVTYNDTGFISLKFSTFKILIYNQNDGFINETDLFELLSSHENISKPYSTVIEVVESDFNTTKNIVYEFVCLCDSLPANTSLRDEIINELLSYGFNSSYIYSYYVKSLPIVFYNNGDIFEITL